MNIKNIIYTVVALSATLSSQMASALGNGDSLQFSENSYFAMEIAPGFWIPTQIVAHDGIIIGQEQPASGSHIGNINGTENPSIDQPWMFFGSTGMQQTIAGSGGITVESNNNSGQFELRFSGFGVTWNGISHIDLSGTLSSTMGDTGLGVLNCSTPACTVGDSYILDYYATVPIGDPSNFGGVRFRLHLEGQVSVAATNLNLRVNVEGGANQECSQYGGSVVNMSASANIPEGDELNSLIWTENSVVIGNGYSISPLLDVGTHNITATLITYDGLADIKMFAVTVRDQTKPVITAEFVSFVTGEAISIIDKERKVNLRIAATDVCDPSPVITYSNLKKNESVSVVNGDEFMTLPNKSTDIHQFQESLRLVVNAKDNQGNIASKTSSLIIRD